MAFLDELLERLAREERTQPLTARAVVAILAADYGGLRPYIGTRPPRPEILPTDTPQVVQQRYKVSRRTAYNWVNGWRG